MPELPEQHGNDGHCKHCGARLSLVKRMSRQEFCGNAHREEYHRIHGDAALGRLQEAARPKPSTAPGLGLNKPATDPGSAKPVGSILGLSSPPPAAAPEPPPPPPVRAAAPPTRVEQAAPAPQPARPAPAASKTPPPNFRAAQPSTPPATTMALARTRPRPAAAQKAGAPVDPALSRLMELGPAQNPPVARAPMRFVPGRALPTPESEAPVVRATPVDETLQPPIRTAAPPPAAPAPAPAAPAPQAAAPESEPEPAVETVTVERRGARPPASFVLTGQCARGPLGPRPWDEYECESVSLTPVALPAPPKAEETVGMLKIDGERIPGTVDQVRPVAGDLMTILVVRATPSLLPGIMEMPAGPRVEPNDWKAFALWVRERIRQQDGPDPAWLVEMPDVAPRNPEAHFVQALFGADRFWPNPKTYIVYPSRELVRRPLLKGANLPVEQDTVPLLVSRSYEAAHRRVLAEWSQNDSGEAGESSMPQAGAVPPPMEANAGATSVRDSGSQPSAIQALSALPQSGLRPSSTDAQESLAAHPSSFPSHNAPVLPGLSLNAEEADSPWLPAEPTNAGPAPRMFTTASGGSQYLLGGFNGSVVLPRYGMRMSPATGDRPLVVLHRQPPVARLVTLELDPADRDATPAPAPPLVHDTIQPEIRQAPSVRPVGRLTAGLRLHSLLALDGTESDASSPLRADEESLSWSWLDSPRPAVPTARVTIRRASVPVPRTAVRLAGADRPAEFFLSPTPAEFVANVDQWSAL